MNRHPSSALPRLCSQGAQGYCSSHYPEAPLQCRAGIQPREVAPRYCLIAEFSFRPILPLHRREEPVWICGGFRLVGHLRAETPAHHNGVHQTRRETLGQEHALASTAGDYLPGRLLSAVENRIGHDPRLIDRGEPLGLTPSLVRALVKNGVLMAAGMTFVTPMVSHPSRKSSTRSDSRKPSTPCLEALQALCKGAERLPTTDEMCTSSPRPSRFMC